MSANTPCLNLERPNFGSTRWDLSLNNNFTILDEVICQLQASVFGLSGQSTLQDMVHDLLIQELSASPSNLRNGRETFVLSAVDISGMGVVLNVNPDVTEEFPHLKIEGAAEVIYGVDYVLRNDNEISWDPSLVENNDLHDVFIEGDEIVVEYNYLS